MRLWIWKFDSFVPFVQGENFLVMKIRIEFLGMECFSKTVFWRLYLSLQCDCSLPKFSDEILLCRRILDYVDVTSHRNSYDRYFCFRLCDIRNSACQTLGTCVKNGTAEKEASRGAE